MCVTRSSSVSVRVCISGLEAVAEEDVKAAERSVEMLSRNICDSATLLVC